MELVSVVVVTFNSASTIIETLESIRRQSYNNLELIISDDCSEDSTRLIVNSWIKKNRFRFDRICCCKTKENLGVTYNCNNGLSKAKGEYIQFIAGDDILLNDAISIKVDFIINRKCNFVYNAIEVFGDNKIKVAEMQRCYNKTKCILSTNWKTQYKEMLKKNFIIGPMGSFFKTDFLKSIGGYDNRFPMLEDYPLHLKILCKGIKIEYIDRPLAKYRVSSSSLSFSQKSLYLQSVNKFFIVVKAWKLFQQKMYKELANQMKNYIVFIFLK